MQNRAKIMYLSYI